MENVEKDDLINEIDRKDLIIKTLQNQLKENMIYFKRDSIFESIEKQKNEIKRKDSEIIFLNSKLQSLLSENTQLKISFSSLRDENFELKLKYTNEIEKLNIIINNYCENQKKSQSVIEQLKQKLSKTTNDNSQIIFNNEKINSKISLYEKNFKDYESKREMLKDEVNMWKEKYSQIEIDYKENKIKYEQLAEQVREINLRLQILTKENFETKNNISKLINELTFWFTENDFLSGGGMKFPSLIYENSNIGGINFAPLYDGIIGWQEKIKEILEGWEGNRKGGEKGERGKGGNKQDYENIIQDNINLIKDNIALKNQLNIKDNTINQLMKQLNRNINNKNFDNNNNE